MAERGGSPADKREVSSAAALYLQLLTAFLDTGPGAQGPGYRLFLPGSVATANPKMPLRSSDLTKWTAAVTCPVAS